MYQNDVLRNLESYKADQPNAAKFAPIAVGATALMFVLFKLMHRSSKGVKSHQHEALEHAHEHLHVTHNRNDESKKVGGWQHLSARHTHSHNHPAVEHSHREHRDIDSEHQQEAHVHDHSHPTVS